MNIQEKIEQLVSLRAHCQSMVCDEDSDTHFWKRDCEALEWAVSVLQGKRIFPAKEGVPVETALPDNDTDVQVTVQELEPGGETYRDVDCIIDEGDGPVWAAHHRACERVLAWAPMLPVYQPEKAESKKQIKQKPILDAIYHQDYYCPSCEEFLARKNEDKPYRCKYEQAIDWNK